MKCKYKEVNCYVITYGLKSARSRLGDTNLLKFQKSSVPHMSGKYRVTHPNT